MILEVLASSPTDHLRSVLRHIDQCEADVAAVALLERFGSLGAILNASPEAIARVAGVGTAASALLTAIRRLALAAAAESLLNRDVIASWSELESYLIQRYAGRGREEALGLFLDQQNRLIREVSFGAGIPHHCPLYPREVARHALELDATAVILAHYHPGGSRRPSRADIEVTRATRAALTVLDVALHDHALVVDGSVISFRSLGVL